MSDSTLSSLTRLLTSFKAAFPLLNDYLNATVDPDNALLGFDYDPSAELSCGNILPDQDAPMQDAAVHVESRVRNSTLPLVPDQLKPLSKTAEYAIRKQRRADIDVFTKEDPVPISAVLHRMLKDAGYPVENPLKAAHDD